MAVSSCSNKTFTASGNVSTTLLQTGTSVSGRLDLANFISIDSNCNATTIESTRVVVGTISGSTLMLSVPSSSNATQYQGSINGNSITLQWTNAAGAMGTLLLAKTSGDAPAIDVTGAWSGNYSFTDTCSNNATAKYTGAFFRARSRTIATGWRGSSRKHRQRVVLYSTTGGPPIATPLDSAASLSGWTSDSRGLLFIRRGDPQFRLDRYDLPTGRVEPFRDISIPATDFMTIDLLAAPDGATWATTVYSSTADVYIIDGAR